VYIATFSLNQEQGKSKMGSVLAAAAMIMPWLLSLVTFASTSARLSPVELSKIALPP
jgi:hypothetical protein